MHPIHVRRPFGSIARFTLVALALIGLVVACSMATLNRVDPMAYNPDGGVCPMRCPGGCCTLGGQADGYECAPLGAGGPCSWTGAGIGPGDPNALSKKFSRDGGRGDAGR